MRYLVILSLALVMTLASGCGQTSAPATTSAPEGSFRFVVISDRNGGNIPGLWPKAIEEINLLKPELVMSVGDFITGYTEDVSELDKQWTEFLAENSKLEAPFFFTPGNHDITNPTMRPVYLKRFGRDGRSYYSFSHKGCHFTVLDSTLFTKQGIDPNQLEWLKTDMATAKGASHVFLFYHHPANEKSVVWKQIAPLLTPGKATVFNGHTHWMSYAKQNDIDTYTLAATAAEMSDSGPDFGNFKMFTYVTFDAGKATVAALTVGQVYSGKNVDRAFDEVVWPLRKQCDIVQTPTADGRTVTVIQSNTSPLTFDLSATIDAYGWQVSPRKAAVSLKPGEKQEIQFDLKECGSGSPADAPQVKCVYTFTNPDGKPATMNMSTTLGRFSTIGQAASITVDGKLDDWAGIAAETMPAFGNLLTEGTNWFGDKDFSSGVKLACDDTTLYVAVDVTDDNLRAGLSPATQNDGFGFTWSVPAAWRSSEPNMPVTGSVRLIPVAGQVEPIWAIGKKLTKPTGFKAFASKTEHGYICELAIPFSGIGAKTPVKPGEQLQWRLQFRDIDDPKKAANVFTVGGTAEPKESVQTWITGVVK